MTVPAVLSTHPGITWPGLPGRDAAQLLAIQFQFARSERWPADVLEAQQLRQIEALIAHCDRAAPFWRDRLRQAGLRPGQKLTPHLWSRLPILTRAQAQAAGERLRSDWLPPNHGEAMEGATSGSTGIPLQFSRTELDQLVWSAVNLRQSLWHGADVAGKMIVIRRIRSATTMTRELTQFPNWGMSFAPYVTGPALHLDIRLPIDEQVDCLAREAPSSILTFPSNAALLARHCLDQGRRLPSLRMINSFGEVLTQETRLACRAAFGVEIVDAYSAEEAGFLALQCPGKLHHHAMSDVVKLEVLDEAGKACAPGQIGRVVVTPLANFAMPLLRYEIGDYAEMGGPCSCGRTLPVLSRILGRARDQVILPGGAQRVPFYGSTHLHHIPAIIQHQLAQIDLDTLEYRLVVHRKLEPAEEARLTEMLRTGLGHVFTVRFRYVDEIPRSPSGKYQDFRCEIADADLV